MDVMDWDFNCPNCNSIEPKAAPSDRKFLTLPHRAFTDLVVFVDGMTECPDCQNPYIPSPEDFDHAVDVAYGKRLRERVPAALLRLEAHGFDEFDIEVMLGLDAGEIEKVVKSDSVEDPVTKVLAAVDCVCVLLEKNLENKTPVKLR